MTMKIAAVIGAVLFGVLVLAFSYTAGYVISVNNQLVTLDQNATAKWAGVQAMYQRRSDLIPNLVETVQGFARQERRVLTEVTRARASATGMQLTADAIKDPAALAKFQAAQSQLSGALARLLVTIEKYPHLKSSAHFLALQDQLEATENRIAVERQRFNGAVQDYNTRVRLWPGSLVAQRAGYRERPYFEADANAAKAPRVTFPQ